MRIRDLRRPLNEQGDPHAQLIQFLKSGYTPKVPDEKIKLLDDQPLPPTLLIQFTDTPKSIATQGFTQGTPIGPELGMTFGSRQTGPGYNFGFVVDDVDTQYSKGFSYFANSRAGAVVFRSSGVLTRHVRDRINQVIFWGPSVSEFLYILQKKNQRAWDVYDAESKRGGHAHYGTYSLRDLMNWLRGQ